MSRRRPMKTSEQSVSLRRGHSPAAMEGLEPRLLMSHTILWASGPADGSVLTAGFNTGLDISADGRYVAFKSTSKGLVAGDQGILTGYYVFDSLTGLTEPVSGPIDGQPVFSWTWAAPSISADGRYVAFTFAGANLVAGDTNAKEDAFVYDRQTATTQRVSVASDGTQANGDTTRVSMSDDGRYVAFESEASNLVAGDTNGCWDVFVRDLQTGTTQRVSVATDGTQGDATSYGIDISADGRHVVFSSHATNLVADDANGAQDVFVHDLQTGATEIVSVASDGTQGDDDSDSMGVSADGRYVVFLSDATTLVAGDTNGFSDAFVHDCQTGVTQRVSVATDGTQGNERVDDASISPDGSVVVFASWATNMVQQPQTLDSLYFHDMQTGTTSLPDLLADENEGSFLVSFASDPRYFAFLSNSTNLLPGAGTNKYDVFWYGPAQHTGACHFTNSPADPTVMLVGQQFSFDLDSTEEGAGAVYSLTAGPSWLSVNGATGVLTGTPKFSTDINTSTVTVHVADSLGNSDSLSFDVTVQGQIITLRSLKKQNKAVVSDANGDLVTVTLAGKVGNVVLVRALAPVGGAYSNSQRADIYGVELQGTSAKSGLKLAAKMDKKAKAGNKLTTIAIVSGSGSLKNLPLKMADLVGDGVVLTGGGMIPSVVVRNVADGAGFKLPGATRGVTIKAARVGDDCDVTVGSPVKSITAFEWLGGTMTATQINKLTISGNKKAGVVGDFGASLTLSGVGVLASKPTLATAKITGRVIGGEWNVHGGIKSVQSRQWNGGDMQADWLGMIQTGEFKGDVDLLGRTLPKNGTVLGSAKIAGGLTDSDWRFEAGNVGAIAIAGTADSSTVRALHSIGTVTVGASLDSDFLAGVRMPGQGETLRCANGVTAPLDASAVIKSFTVAGEKGPHAPAILFEDSNISAAAIGSVVLRNADLGVGQSGIYVLGSGLSPLGRATYTDSDATRNWTWAWDEPAMPGLIHVL